MIYNIGMEVYDSFDFCDAFKPLPPVEWVVEGLLAKDNLAVFVGAPGSKKTYSLLSMAVCVASGKPWLGFTTIQSPVLIIDEESGPIGLKRRLFKVGMGESVDSNLPIKCFSFQKINFNDSKKLADLKTLINQQKAGLVLVDALIDLIPGVDENSAEEMNPPLKALAEISKETNCVIVLIHHTNKIGDFRGSMVIKSACDIMVSVKPQGKTRILFDFMKARDIEGAAFSAESHFDEDKFWLTPSDNIQKTKTLSKSQEAVYSYLKEHGATAAVEIKNNIEGCSMDAARKAISSLEKLGKIRRSNAGSRGTPAIYELTNY